MGAAIADRGMVMNRMNDDLGIRRTPMIIMALVVVIVSACSAAEAPSITAEQEAEMTARSVLDACAMSCGSLTVYIHDVLFTSDTLSGNEVEMPTTTAEAIVEVMPGAQFVTNAEADALFGDDALVDGGRGVLVSVGPVEELTDDVAGIEVGVTTARDGGLGTIHQFRWNGETWEPTTSDVTGVTTTSWMS